MTRRTYAGVFYAHVEQPVPIHSFEGVTWPDLVAALTQPRPALAKEQVPLLGPYKLRIPHRGDSNVEYVSFAVLDLDLKGGTKKDPIYFTEADILKISADFDCDHTVATTFSHGGPNAFKCRIFIPLSRDVLSSEWPALWEALNQKYVDGKADPQCKSVSHSYYLHSHKDGGPAEPLAWSISISDTEETPCDVERTLFEFGTRRSGEQARETTPTLSSLKWLRRRWQQNKRKGVPIEALSKLINGEPYAEAGERDNVAFRLCCQFVEAWPDLNVEETAKLFLPSTALMGHDAPDKANIEGKLKRAKQSRVDRIAERIRQARGDGSGDPYSPEELHAAADRIRVSDSDLIHHWVIQKNTTFYVLILKNGTHIYVPRTKDEIQASMLVDLAPAISAHVDVEVTGEKGTRPKSTVELMRDYGTVAKKVQVNLTAQYPYLDPETGIFTEAPCPLRVTPQRDPQVEEFFSLFAGVKHDDFLLWVASLTLLERPCAALYVEGDPGVGKSLLAHGLAKLWSPNGPVMLADALEGDFNDAIIKSPFIFGDEFVPILRGRGHITSVLREYIQAHIRSLRRKYMPVADLIGSPRLYFAANNRNLLQVAEHMTQADILAFAERVMFVAVLSSSDKVLHPARRFLASLPHDTVRSWVDGDVMARHALYLRDTINTNTPHRFIVPGSQSELTMHLATSSGLTPRVAMWIIGWLRQPADLANVAAGRTSILVVREKDGSYSLLVRPDIVQDKWDAYVKNDRNPPNDVAKVSQALRTLSKGRRFRRIDGHAQQYQEVDMEKICYWSNENSVATREEVNGLMTLRGEEWARARATGADRGEIE